MPGARIACALVGGWLSASECGWAHPTVMIACSNARCGGVRVQQVQSADLPSKRWQCAADHLVGAFMATHASCNFPSGPIHACTQLAVAHVPAVVAFLLRMLHRRYQAALFHPSFQLHSRKPMVRWSQTPSPTPVVTPLRLEHGSAG